MDNNQIIRIKKVRELTGLSTSSIWRREKEGSFPARRHLGRRSVGWVTHEINDWIINCQKKQFAHR